MAFLNNLPLAYHGELHHTRLINFSVEADEIRPLLPYPLEPKLFNDRALISVVDVELHKLRPKPLPLPASRNYRHIAFRLILKADEKKTDDARAVFFLRSFSENPLLVQASTLLHHNWLEQAEIDTASNMVEIRTGEQFFNYAWADQHPATCNPHLRQAIQPLDRAYAVHNSTVMETRMPQSGWQLEWIECYHMQTNLFETARLEGAFRVPGVVPYQWQTPTSLTLPATYRQQPPRMANVSS